jgi:hypothetical protein
MVVGTVVVVIVVATAAGFLWWAANTCTRYASYGKGKDCLAQHGPVSDAWSYCMRTGERLEANQERFRRCVQDFLARQ